MTNTGENNNQDVTILPNHIFIRANEISVADLTPSTSSDVPIFHSDLTTIDHPAYKQDYEVLKTWIDPYHLKNIHGMWYKNSQ